MKETGGREWGLFNRLRDRMRSQKKKRGGQVPFYLLFKEIIWYVAFAIQ